MDVELISFEFKTDNVRSLVLVQVLREDVGTLSVRLTPLLSFCIEQLQAKQTLSELTHHVHPE